MTIQKSDQNSAQIKTVKDETEVTVTRDDLPLHCPTADSPLWASHPRVFLAVEESGEASCPYCGTRYRLDTSASST